MHKQNIPDLDQRARRAMAENGFAPNFPLEVLARVASLTKGRARLCGEPVTTREKM